MKYEFFLSMLSNLRVAVSLIIILLWVLLHLDYPTDQPPYMQTLNLQSSTFYLQQSLCKLHYQLKNGTGWLNEILPVSSLVAFNFFFFLFTKVFLIRVFFTKALIWKKFSSVLKSLFFTQSVRFKPALRQAAWLSIFLYFLQENQYCYTS